MSANKDVLAPAVWEALVELEGKDPAKGIDEDFEKLAYPELLEFKVGKLLKPTFYTLSRKCAKEGRDAAWLAAGMCNLAEHWSTGQCLEGCSEFWGGEECECKCATKTGFYEAGGATHKAVAKWLKERFTPSKCQPYTYADENYLSECFHAALLKFAPKRIAFRKTMNARIAMAILAWNEGMARDIRNVHIRKNIRESEFHKRAGVVRRLEKPTFYWKIDVAALMGLFW